jgi:hypothetical protein
MFWTLYIIVTITATSEQTYVGVQSFSDRVSCESALETRKLLVDEKYDFKFKCLRTDSHLGN